MAVLDAAGNTIVETPHKTDQNGPSEEMTKKLEALERERDEAKALNATLTSKYADVEEQNRGLGRMKKQVDGWLERVKNDPSKVLEELGGDPLVVGTQVLGDVDLGNQPDDPPDWFKSYVDEDRKWKQGREQKDKHETAQGEHWQRFGALRAHMAQEGSAEKYPFVAMMGDGALEIVADKMKERHKRDGYPPTPAQMLEEQNKFMDEWSSGTTKMWAKNKITARRMLEALQEEGGYSIHGASPRLTLMNEDDGVAGEEVDTSKLTGEALIKYNMELADRATEAGERG